MKPLKQLDISQLNNIDGVCFFRGDNRRVAVWARIDGPYENSRAWLHDHLEFWDLPTGTFYKKLYYERASNATEVLLSPDKKYVACVIEDTEGETYSAVEVMNPITGHEIWSIQGSEKEPVRGPFFFLSANRLASGNNIYNLKTQQVTPLMPDRTDLRCISSVDTQPGLAFFQSKDGLELWDIPAKTILKRWPLIKEAVAVYLSPDRTVMAVVTSPQAGGVGVTEYEHAAIQFWRFTPGMLSRGQG